MVSRIHPNSGDGHLNGLISAFQVPPTQIDAMSSDRYQVYNSLESATTIGEGQNITLEIPGASSGSYYDLSRSHIQCKCKFVHAGALPTDYDSKIAPVFGWTSRVFNRMSCTFGSTSVVEDYADYGVSHLLHQLWSRSRSDLQADEFVGGWTEDTINAMALADELTTTLRTNQGATDRRDWSLLGSAAGARPNLSFNHVPLGPWAETKCLPSDVNIRVRLTRGKNAELVYGNEVSSHTFSLQLESVQAYMFRVVMTPDADRALLAMMAKNDLLVPHQRVRQMTQSFEAGTTVMEIRAALQGPRPNRVYCWTAFEEALTGTYENATPFRLDGTTTMTAPGQSAIDVRLRVGDVDVPLRGFESTPGSATGTMEGIRPGSKDFAEVYGALQALSYPGDPGITSRQFTNIRIWAFDCSIVSAAIQDPVIESTQVQLTMRLDQANRKRRVLGLISYGSSVIQISKDRTISLDV